jgi:hypothetical protein
MTFLWANAIQYLAHAVYWCTRWPRLLVVKLKVSKHTTLLLQSVMFQTWLKLLFLCNQVIQNNKDQTQQQLANVFLLVWFVKPPAPRKNKMWKCHFNCFTELYQVCGEYLPQQKMQWDICVKWTTGTSRTTVDTVLQHKAKNNINYRRHRVRTNFTPPCSKS